MPSWSDDFLAIRIQTSRFHRNDLFGWDIIFNTVVISKLLGLQIIEVLFVSLLLKSHQKFRDSTACGLQLFPKSWVCNIHSLHLKSFAASATLWSKKGETKLP